MIIITIMSLFIFAKMYSLCHNNQYNNYENQQQKKTATKSRFCLTEIHLGHIDKDVKYILTFRFLAFPVKSRQRYASRYDVYQKYSIRSIYETLIWYIFFAETA